METEAQVSASDVIEDLLDQIRAMHKEMSIIRVQLKAVSAHKIESETQ